MCIAEKQVVEPELARPCARNVNNNDPSQYISIHQLE